jgi:hypothetical protein
MATLSQGAATIGFGLGDRDGAGLVDAAGSEPVVEAAVVAAGLDGVHAATASTRITSAGVRRDDLIGVSSRPSIRS